MQYSLAPTDDRIRFWRSQVKGQGHSRLSRWLSHSCLCWGIKVHFLVLKI